MRSGYSRLFACSLMKPMAMELNMRMGADEDG